MADPDISCHRHSMALDIGHGPCGGGGRNSPPVPQGQPHSIREGPHGALLYEGDININIKQYISFP